MMQPITVPSQTRTLRQRHPSVAQNVILVAVEVVLPGDFQVAGQPIAMRDWTAATGGLEAFETRFRQFPGRSLRLDPWNGAGSERFAPSARHRGLRACASGLLNSLRSAILLVNDTGVLISAIGAHRVCALRPQKRVRLRSNRRKRVFQFSGGIIFPGFRYKGNRRGQQSWCSYFFFGGKNFFSTDATIT